MAAFDLELIPMNGKHSSAVSNGRRLPVGILKSNPYWPSNFYNPFKSETLK
jgi:hypothetical protein